MAAATKSRNTTFRNVRGVRSVPLKAAAKVFKGCLVATDATGFGIAPGVATGLITAGLAIADVDNTAGGNGALSVDVLLCEAYLNSDGTVDQTNFDASVFINDDNTVAKTNGGSTKSAAGNCTGFDAGGAWVSLGVL
jgi:hypothetical protein